MMESMEVSPLDLLLEELLCPSRDKYCSSVISTTTTSANAACCLETFDHHQQLSSDLAPSSSLSNSSVLGSLISPLESSFACQQLMSSEPSCPLVDFCNYTLPVPFECSSLSYVKNERIIFPNNNNNNHPLEDHHRHRHHGYCCSRDQTLVEKGGGNDFHHPHGVEADEHAIKSSSREAYHQIEEKEAAAAAAEEGNYGENNKCNKGKNKLVKGGRHPSKNLMAERRRRKRLNDRLSMLRSIVPKISKMDRTSILADTIDYMKELLHKVGKSYPQDHVEDDDHQVKKLLPTTFMRDLKPNQLLVRNLPKFDVVRREQEMRIEISCPAKPGLLLSTVTTLEALGIDIQQCVTSCFNDFSLRASCFEAAGQGTVLSSEAVKQALFRNAGYGGRCL